MNRYAHLLRTTTSGMLIVLALLFAKTADALALFVTEQTTARLTGVVTIADIVLILLAVVATVTIAHAEYGVPYRPLYFLLGLLMITFPLYVAVECVYRATAKGSGEEIDERLFRIGMVALAITFVFLVIYLFLVALGELPNGVRRSSLLMIMPFHVVGSILAIVAAMWPAIARNLSIGGLVLSALFLFFYWALQVRFKLRD